MKTAMKVLCGLLASALSTVFGWFNLYWYPHGQKLALDKRFDLVWSDEFNGDALDAANWRIHRSPYWEGDAATEACPRRDGYWFPDTLSVADGSLIIDTRWEPDGLGGGGAGYYSEAISTEGLHEFKQGYFEARCILPKGEGLWGAFWMFFPRLGGTVTSGTEIDIFESPYYFKGGWNRDAVCSTVHVYNDPLESKGIGTWRVKKPYDRFNTYGLEWTESEYIFYINGVETGRTDFGVSDVPLYLLLSTEVGAEDTYGWAGNIHNNKTPLDSKFIVDYVRVYEHRQ